MSEAPENKKQEDINTTSTEQEEVNPKVEDQPSDTTDDEASPDAASSHETTPQPAESQEQKTVTEEVNEGAENADDEVSPDAASSHETAPQPAESQEQETVSEEVNEEPENADDEISSDAATSHETAPQPAESQEQETVSEEVNEGTENAEIAEQHQDVVSDVKEEHPQHHADHEDAKQGDDNEEHEDENHVDYSSMGREELVHAIEQQLKNDNIKQADRQAHELKPYFDEIEEHEKAEALKKFVASGGEEDDFDYKQDTLTERFYQAFRLIKERKSNYYEKLSQNLNKNYEDKLNVLNRIRDFVDSEETQVSFNKLKELQQEWRSIGPVPHQHNRNLWANYNALINRFYDNRSIYFELKELDRKKNLEAKLELCEKAEALVEEKDIKKALKELDELHEEYKHLGPVPKEDQEPLWQRFKTASDKVHDRRRAFVDQFKEELNENLKKKLELCEEVQAFITFQSESIREWNQKTKEIQDVQKRWEAVGAMPREKAKDVNKKFWSAFKQFFSHKGEFFKQLDAQRDENLKKKEALVEQAVQLKESDDWQKTANELKRLQREWKEIGPVPEKQREVIYQKFKKACDTFFERKRESNKEQESAYHQNLEAKENICEQIETLAKEGSSDSEKLYELSEAFASIGFVPRNAIKKISQRYEKALEAFMKNAKGLDGQQKDDLKLELEVTSIKGTPRAERKLDHKQSSLRKKISRMEEDISLWKNNISFFAHSKQADKLKQEYEQKIIEASAELEHLKAQLDMIENMR
jgi:hypothetical protein